ncbi:TonB-dependent receptor domain-containing protein [Roseateles cellulosilyticus]|uniref:TonB-dependent receptor n=1 Tax=Pelomonas cellulosilytica TaxID=2906762 RepID=A0ABS8Y2P0_9BURK|nr:TonB-dependent receptor [Pelomonas sp. P8]MCE4557950.1 TonB-dependent receptor [Pelomonas sp. P8]
MSTLAVLVCSAWASNVVAQAEAGKPATPAPVKKPDETGKDEPVKLNTIEVTGSRLRNGDVTSNVTVITAEEIQARGVSSVEELLRTLPQNLATIGDITNERGRSPLSQRNAPVGALGQLGVSAANLGGMGAGNTLILVNGRRMAGAAGIEDGFVNLNGIPLSAIERVEITQGGSSAVYGSDAMAGVINFILKKDFRGTTVTAKYVNSNNGADERRASVASGYAWGSGSVSGTLDFSKRMPVINAKTGYVTQNYSGYYNGDTNYDRRSLSYGLQPGVISTPEYNFDPDTGISTTIVKGLTVPKGFKGRPTVSDFITVGADAMRDYVPRTDGAEVKSASMSLNLEQELGHGLRLFANGLLTRATNTLERNYEAGLTVTLAPGQYYNPFAANAFNDFSPGTPVSYNPAAEVAAGQLPVGTLSNVNRSWVATAGLAWDVNSETHAELIYTTSRTTSSGRSANLGSLVDLIDDPTSPNGVSCFNLQLSNPLANLNGVDPAAYRAAFDRQCRALTSSDPNVAFNPFKSTADGGGSSVAAFLYDNDVEDRGSRLENVELRVTGRLATLPGGKVYYAAGTEYNDDGVNSREVKAFTGTSPNRRRHAYFGEVTVPVFGSGFRRPFMHALALNVAARRDIYTTSGAIGTVNNVPPDQGGELIFGKGTFARTTPALGVMWQPTDTLTVRAKQTQGFKAPPYTQLFRQQGTVVGETIIFNDPGYKCTTDCWLGRDAYKVPSKIAPNPDLRPETSKQQSLGINWSPEDALQGLNLSATWSRTKIKNQFARPGDLNRLLPQKQVLLLSQFYPRDANGKITEARNMTFNIVGSVYESITYEASYLLQLGNGTLEPHITVVDNLKSETQGLLNGGAVSNLGKLQGPDRYKVVSSLGWYHHDYSLMLWAYYTPSYLNDYESLTAAGVVTNPEYAKHVDHYLTLDLSGVWNVDKHARVAVAVRNLLDAKPPFVVVGALPYDTARYNVAGRTVSVELSYSF